MSVVKVENYDGEEGFIDGTRFGVFRHTDGSYLVRDQRAYRIVLENECSPLALAIPVSDSGFLEDLLSSYGAYLGRLQQLMDKAEQIF